MWGGSPREVSHVGDAPFVGHQHPALVRRHARDFHRSGWRCGPHSSRMATCESHQAGRANRPQHRSQDRVHLRRRSRESPKPAEPALTARMRRHSRTGSSRGYPCSAPSMAGDRCQARRHKPAARGMERPPRPQKKSDLSGRRRRALNTSTGPPRRPSRARPGRRPGRPPAVGSSRRSAPRPRPGHGNQCPGPTPITAGNPSEKVPDLSGRGRAPVNNFQPARRGRPARGTDARRTMSRLPWCLIKSYLIFMP
jgi:hypothetical protein